MSEIPIKIRDFGYKSEDSRHFGVYPTLKEAPTFHKEPAEKNESSPSEDEEESQLEPPTPIVSDKKCSANPHLSQFSLSVNGHLYDSDEETDLTVDWKNKHTDPVASILIPSLKHILHLTPAVDDGLRFDFYAAKVMYDFKKVTEWEMNIEGGEVLVIAFRDVNYESKHSSPESEKLPESLAVEVNRKLSQDNSQNERMASIDSPEPVPPPTLEPAVPFQMTIPTLLDPEPDTFATHLREFVEYQKVYGEGWTTALRLHIQGKLADKSRLKLRLVDLGLIPNSFVQKI